VGQGLDAIYNRKYPMGNLRDMAESQSCSMFHAMRPEILASEGFAKNLQQNLIRFIFFMSFPQKVHKFDKSHHRRAFIYSH
jgi:hypothetical protein